MRLHILLLLIYHLLPLFCCDKVVLSENGQREDMALSYLQWKLNPYALGSSMMSPGISSGFNGNSLGHNNSSDVIPNCQAFVTEFSKRASKFIKCSVDNARPFRFCEQCVEDYQKAKRVYEDIEANDEKMDNCKAILLNSDRVQVINSVHLDIESIWNSADCGKCFSDIHEDDNGTVHYTLTGYTQEFLDFYEQFTQCIPKNTTHNATVCAECEKYYSQMNNLFDTLLNDKISPQHVCMDIVDMMNYTRLTWGDQLNCTNVHREYAAVFAVGVCLLVIPLTFYISLGVYGTKRTRNLMKAKRLSLFEQSHEYGTLDSPATVGNQSTSQEPAWNGSHDQTSQEPAWNGSHDQTSQEPAWTGSHDQTDALIHNNVGNQTNNVQNRNSYQSLS